MDITILIAIASTVTILIFAIQFYFRLKNKDTPTPVRRNAGPGRLQAARNQRARMRANAVRHQQVVHEEDENEDDNFDDDDTQKQTPIFDDNIGAKKRAKLEAKAEKKAAREAEEQFREEKKKRDALLDEEKRKKEEKEKAEEVKQEEEEKRLIAEKEKKELEEYLAMKAAFTVEGEGFEENDNEGNEENLLKEFLDYIKEKKVVLLEDLAAHFKLKTQAVIDRITALQADGELTGVVDDRGKFIYISQEELEEVARFIKQRGRVSITDLAESSNNLINLNPVST